MLLIHFLSIILSLSSHHYSSFKILSHTRCDPTFLYHYSHKLFCYAIDLRPSINLADYIVSGVPIFSYKKKPTVLFGSKDDACKSESQLSVDEIASRWRIIKFNGYSNDAYYGLDQLDKNYYPKAEKVSCSFFCRTSKIIVLIVVVEQITVSRIGGIGLDLLEMQVTDDRRAGLVMVGGFAANSNAEKCGLFRPGDVLIGISSVETESEYILWNLLRGNK